MGAIVQSVTELWVQVYSPLQNNVCICTVCYRNMGTIIQSVTDRTMGAIIQSGTELWGEVYRLLQNYEYNNTVCYGIMGASLRSCYRITVVYLKVLQNYGFEFNPYRTNVENRVSS